MVEVRCDSCGSHNPDGAAWCNLCFSDLSGHPERPRRSTDGPTVARSTPDAAASRGASHRATHPGRAGTSLPDPDTDAAAGSAAFRGGSGAAEWRCPSCGRWVPLDTAACPLCATPLRARLSDAHHRDRPPPPVARTVIANALLPGVGHLLAGWTGSGLARIVLYVVWVTGGLALTSAGGGLVGFPLLVGAALLWVTAIHDGWRLAHQGPQILSGRMLLWLVVGVTVLSILGVVAATVSTAP